MRLFGFVAVLSLLSAGSAFAQLRRVDMAPVVQVNSPDTGRVAAASGIFDLKTSKGPNSCRMTLWPEGAKGKFPVSMPAGCHKAFPSLLMQVKNWSISDDGAMSLLDEKAATVLEFRETDGKLLSAEISDVTYELLPADAGWFKRQAAISRKVQAVGGTKPVDAAEIARVAGTHAVIREKGKPSECKLIFAIQASVKPGFMKAGIAEACTDRGMQIFNPVAWRLDTSRLLLVSRKGHDIAFIRAGAAGWKKEKQSGDMLELVKQ